MLRKMAFMPPFGPQGQQQAPTAPPPQFTPQQPAATTFAVDPGAISGCLFRNTYVWLSGGRGFWFYPVFVGRTSVAGFRWNGFFWMYTGIDLRQIQSFTCF
ncbi:transporter [Paenibacillus sp. SAF-054]|uniref:transporter n=2 Tax=unclassified Paenibacillus TaxID=185978 RepID=UPI003F7CE247